MSSLKLLLVDGNNLSHRVFWTHQELQYKGNFTGVMFGFCRQLSYLRKKFPEHYPVIVWDGGYARRKEESRKAVELGIVPSAYKETREQAREDQEQQEKMEIIRTQMDVLKTDILPLVRCTQALVGGVEADDLVYTYCQYVTKWGGEAIAVSSDRDFYQLLGIGNNISVFDAMKDTMWTQERFEIEFGFHPKFWVDAGALMGESGSSSDNIFGVDGWGPKTSCEYVRLYGDVDSIIKVVVAKTKKTKKEQKLLDSIPRLRLSKSLKAMDVIPNFPMPRCEKRDKEALKSKFIEFGFMSLLKDAEVLV